MPEVTEERPPEAPVTRPGIPDVTINPGQQPDVKATFKDIQGIKLVWGVLCLIGLFLLLFGVFIGLGEWYYAGYLSKWLPLPVASEITSQLIDSLKSEHKEFREYWLKVLQIVLVNVFLPVLTGLLGYIFATQRDASS
jgi:hypothetical protein